MPERLVGLLHGIGGAWDAGLAALASSQILPAVTSEGKALALVLTVAGTIFSAGVGFAALVAGWTDVPPRLAAVEEVARLNAEAVVRIERYLCEIRSTQVGLDPLACYRVEYEP